MRSKLMLVLGILLILVPLAGATPPRVLPSDADEGPVLAPPAAASVPQLGSRTDVIERKSDHVMFSTIQAAIDDPETGVGEVLQFVVAAHSEGATPQILVNKAVTIEGMLGGTTLTPLTNGGSAGSGAARGWFRITADGATLRNLILDGQVGPEPTYRDVIIAVLIHETANHTTIDSCTIRNIGPWSDTSSYDGRGIAAYAGTTTVTDCIMSNIYRIGVFNYYAGTVTTITNLHYTGKGEGDWLDYGIEAGGGAAVTATGCMITSCGGLAQGTWGSAGVLASTYYALGTSITLTGCTITGNSMGVAIGYDEEDQTAAIVQGNDLSDNSYGGDSYGLVNYGADLTVAASPNWWGDGDPSDDLYGPVDYSPCWGANYVGDSHASPWIWYTDDSIQAAINAATGGDQIHVAAGIYPEHVTVSKRLDLRGAQYGVDPTPIGARTNPAVESTIDITGIGVLNPNVAVEIPIGSTGTTFDGFRVLGRPIEPNADGSCLRCWSGSTAILNNILDGFYAVIHKGNTNLAIDHNRIVANKLGLTLQPGACDNVSVAGNCISRGTTPASDAAGMYLTSVTNVTITGNVATGFTGSNGIGGSNDGQVTISNNDLRGNKKGVSLWGNTTFVTIAENVLSDCTQKGIEIKGQDITIRNNEIRNCGVGGIQVDKHTLTTERVVIRENDLGGNATYALAVTDAVLATVDASLNWWGIAAPAGVRGQISLGTVSSADYTPWLAAGADMGDPGFQGDFSTLWVDDDSPQAIATGRIQEGVNLVSGSTVNVVAGTYTEQVILDRAVTLRGPNAGIDPNTGTRVAEAEIHTDDLTNHETVLIDHSDVTVDGFTLYGPNGTIKDIGAVGLKGVDGPRTNVHVQYNRIFRTAAGTDWNCDGIRMDPPGNEAASIWIEHNRVQVGSSQPEGNNDITIADHGYRMAHGDSWNVGDPDRVVIRNNYLYGHGKMYIEGIGVLIDANVFDGIWGPIEIRGAKDVVISGNRMVDQFDIGIFAWSPVTGCSGAGLCTDVQISGNEITGTQLDAQDFTDDGSAIILGGVANAAVTRNVLTGNASNGVVVGGIGYDHFYPTDVDEWGVALSVAYDPVNNVVHENGISGNLYGANNHTTVILNAEDNWWGASTGPTHLTNPLGTGDRVSDYVDFDPWRSGNVVCVPDPKVLSGAVPEGDVVVSYLGGGSGGAYGYSIDVQWDNTVVSATTGSFTRPATGPFHDAGLFQVVAQGTDGNGLYKVRIDAALGGGQPGTFGPADLFKATFTAAGSHDYWTSPVDLTVRSVRDNNNNILTGFTADDGQIIVDRVGPNVTAVFIDNTTLTHTDAFIKDGDGATVTATVTDADTSFGAGNITADLSGLGGDDEAAPTSYDGTTATWVMAAPPGVNTDPADGDVTVTVTATDPIGNTANGNDTIHADNTKPGAMEGLTAMPGHKKVTLSWTDKTTLYDDHYAGVVIRWNNWGSYPTYPGSGPSYPGSEMADSLAYNGTGASAVHSFPSYDRDIYYYGGFVYDEARNYSVGATTGQARATNYWLGDVVPDNLWNGTVTTNDISALGSTYYVAQGDSTWNPQCDVGPTHNHSRLGIPQPDVAVDFEDMMIFAMNFGVVTPMVEPPLGLPGTQAWGPIAVSVRLPDVMPLGSEFTVPVILADDRGVAQGVRFSVEYDARVLQYVSAVPGSLVMGCEQNFFMPVIHEGLPLVSAAVLGNGATFGRSGELAILRFRCIGQGPVELALRDLSVRNTLNEDLLAQSSDVVVNPEVAVTLPREVSLHGNQPNPFSHGTSIAYGLPSAQPVRLAVYDVSGRLVRVLVDGVTPAGEQTIQWDRRDSGGRAMPGGVYLYRLETRERTLTHKMIVMD